MTRAAQAQAVKEEARRLGFDACAIAAAGPADPEDRLGAWLGKGFQADMAWMATTREIRQDINLRLPGVQSVIVLARNYSQEVPERPPGSGQVARYAWGRDYHKALKKPLKELAAYCDSLVEGARSVISIDSAPVLERSWAERAGLGWVGKNSLILRRDMGSYFFLATVMTTVPLHPDDRVTDHCGSCRACIDACPTGAIVEEQVVDAQRCISYQTIENRGEIPLSIQEKMGDWVFGCDICQTVCPWNRFAPPTSAADFAARPGLPFPVLEDLLQQDEESFNRLFEGTPVRRAKYEGMRRNAAIARDNLKKDEAP